jgi:type I restriction enzyme R subunit
MENPKKPNRQAAAREPSALDNHPLSLVREHLVKNLPMDEEDFDLTPLLEMRGGRAKARKVFGDIRKLIEELNEAVAA